MMSHQHPSAAQEVLLLGRAITHARYVWNFRLEQHLMWARWKGPTLGFKAQAAQLTEARRAEPWLAAGSQTVQQQALRDLDAFALIPDPIPAPGAGEVVGVDRGVTVAAALSTGDTTSPAGLSPKEAARLLRLQRRLARDRRG